MLTVYSTSQLAQGSYRHEKIILVFLIINLNENQPIKISCVRHSNSVRLAELYLNRRALLAKQIAE